MLEVYSRDRKKLAILENAFDITETVKINAVSYFEFSLPDTDPKNDYCSKFNIVRYNGGEAYRIISEKMEEEETGYRIYECEHMITTLMNSLIPEFTTIGNLGVYTRDVIEYILSLQKEKHWELKECEFTRQFEYEWDKENLLGALFSVSNRFAEKYLWVFDTKLYPYQISLKKFDENRKPEHYARRGHNRLRLTKQSDGRNICTRLYAYGAGEGVNQLTIAELNGGKKYLQSPPEIIEKHGIIESAFIDRRYTDRQSLLEAAQAVLNGLQEPYEEYEVELLEGAKVGDTVQIVGGIKSYVVETETVYGETPRVRVKIANRPQDIASSIADLADRLRVEMTYSQGATQIYAASMADNADSKTPLNVPFYIPEEMINVNAVMCKVKVSQFRAYNTNVVSGGSTQTSSSGGGTSATSSAGGYVAMSSGSTASISQTSASTKETVISTDTLAEKKYTSTTVKSATIPTDTMAEKKYTSTTAKSATILTDTLAEKKQISTSNGGVSSITSSGGSWTGNIPILSNNVTSESYGANLHNHIVYGPTSFTLNINGHTHGYGISAHTHDITIPAHSHKVTTEAHSHDITVPAHSHKVTTEAHSHEITIPAHSHHITITSHTHSVTIPSHSHPIVIQSHTHSVTIPNHTHTVDTAHSHSIVPQISFFGSPSSFQLLINGVLKKTFSGRDAELDITQYLVKDGKIPRGTWLTIGIQPNDLARVEVSYNVKGFCQSRGDTTV